MLGDGLEGRIERWTLWVIRRRSLVLGVALLLGALAAAGAPRLGLANNYRVFFSADNPDLVAFDELEAVYTPNDNVLFVVKPREGDVFTAEVLGALRELTEDSWQIPYATRVDAITNFQHTWAEGDELVVEDLLPDGPITADAIDRVRSVSLSEPLLAGRLIARDGNAAGVNVRVMLPGVTDQELPEAVASVEDLVDRYRQQYPGLEVHTTGAIMVNNAFATAPLNDGPTVMPLMMAVFIIMIISVLRSVGATVGTLAVILLSTATALGIAGWAGLFLDPASASAPTIIMTLAIADSVHVLVSWRHALGLGRTNTAALIEAMKLNAMPVFLTSITTAIGFLSLNFSDSPPFRLLGNVTALGVLLAWAYSMTVLPAVVSFFPTRGGVRRIGPLDRLVGSTRDLVTRHHRPLLVGALASTVLLTLAIGQMRVNDEYTEYFSRELPVRIGSDFATEHLAGIYYASFSVDSGEENGVSDPGYLSRLDAFADWLEARPNVAHVNSFSRIMKRLNMNMHGDDPQEYRLPDDRDLAAQYLFLYELSLPYGLDLNDQINIDKSSARIDVTYGDVDVATLESEIAAAEAWLDENGTPPMATAGGTGTALMFAKITRRNLASMALGTGLGLLLIAGILVAALRDLRLGLLSLIPNVLPAAMAFGIWALLVGEVGFAISIVAGLSIGIIVDDTVHFLSKYRRARRSSPPREAVSYAFETVGTAILGNTIIVAAGFAMLGLSTFRVTAYMGLLTSLTVVCALFIDFLLLPALLIEFDRRSHEAASEDPTPTHGPEVFAAAGG